MAFRRGLWLIAATALSVTIGVTLPALPALAGPARADRFPERVPAGARAGDPVVTQEATIAGHWRRDPLYVSDNVPAGVTPREVAALRRHLERMPVPTYLAIVSRIDGERRRGEELLDAVHDRLGGDGVYVLTDVSGHGLDAKQYGGVLTGGRLPIRDAAYEVTYSQPHDAGVVRVFGRFVDNVVSGAASRRFEQAKRRDEAGWEPDPVHLESEDIEARAFMIGAGTGVAGAVALLLLRARGRRREAGPAPVPGRRRPRRARRNRART